MGGQGLVAEVAARFGHDGDFMHGAPLVTEDYTRGRAGWRAGAVN